MPNELSWEVPRNASEICRVIRYAILRQWMIPAIDFENLASGYDHDENNSSFIVKNYKTQYRVTVEKI